MAKGSTLFESENERQKIEPVPIPLPRASRNLPDVKTRNEFFLYNWTSEIIPFIRFKIAWTGQINLKKILGYNINYLSI